jgi:metal-responsive CopG/Arc/MetJ family transcriptional regulator
VHIPAALLREVDRRARRAGVSRNRFIVRAVERALESETAWSPGFFERLAAVTAEEVAAVDDLARRMGKRASRKGPPRL